MLYDAYQAQQDLLAPFRVGAELFRTALSQGWQGPAAYWTRGLAAAAEMVTRAQTVHERRPFDLVAPGPDGRPRRIAEEIALALPFGDLVHFRKEQPASQPKVLLVAPMAGHFATLLRPTAQTMLADHDVYITDWKNARDVPLAAGRFGTDDYVDYLIRFLEQIGPGAHAVAVCQPCAALLVAVAAMAMDGNPACPRSMTLMAGPIDTRVHPTEVDGLAMEHSNAWFAENMISAVPSRYAGAGRHVYPGFVQLGAFMAMNLPRHLRAQLDLFGHIALGEEAQADANRAFYDEYFTVADLPAEFYLETVAKVFQEHQLARGLFEYRGRRIDPGAIRATALLTVEGERDDICAPGQTQAAHALCSGIAPARKHHYLQPDVGHYGVFAGGRWRSRIYPIVRDVIRAAQG